MQNSKISKILSFDQMLNTIRQNDARRVTKMMQNRMLAYDKPDFRKFEKMVDPENLNFRHFWPTKSNS